MTTTASTLIRRPRLEALDALRGFVMFWIIGGDGLVQALTVATDFPFLYLIKDQMTHVAWNGFRFYDVIFPTFLFIAGVTIPLSSLRRIEEGKTTRRAELFSGAKRMLLLVLLGLVANGILRGDWGDHFSNVRFGSVLGRIGLAWYFALMITLFWGARGRWGWFAGLLMGYWAALTLIPVPGHGSGILEPGRNLTDYLDGLLLPGCLYEGNHDPEGLLSTIPAIATALMGVATGEFLGNSSASEGRKVAWLALAGVIAVGVAQVWDLAFPINKNLWTSSFVCMAGGVSLIMLAFFHWCSAVCEWTGITRFFAVIGSNAILIYLAADVGLVDFSHTAIRLFSGLINGLEVTPVWYDVLLITGKISLAWTGLWFLWKHKHFARI